jgi:UDP-glucose 4-epimerase
VVEVLPRLLGDPPCHGRVYNVGSDRPISIRALAERVIAATGSRSGTRLVPYAEAYPAGFEDLQRRQPDLSRIRAAVGFEPCRSLDQTIRDVAEFSRAGAASERPGAGAGGAR